ncbi:hypothetical protein D3C87_2088330 [compost metagenome]
MPPSTTTDISIAIHSHCLAGKKLKTKLTSDPAAPASPMPIANARTLMKLTLTPRSSAASRFCVVARMA